ncbi:hypothetical protein ABZX51_001495 [Aspergillus tubingensis]
MASLPQMLTMRLGRHHGEPPLRWDEPTHVAEMNASRAVLLLGRSGTSRGILDSSIQSTLLATAEKWVKVKVAFLVHPFPVVKRKKCAVQHLLHTKKSELWVCRFKTSFFPLFFVATEYSYLYEFFER